MCVSFGLRKNMGRRGKTVGIGSGQSGLQVKQVAGQNMSFLNGLIELRDESDLPVFFK